MKYERNAERSTISDSMVKLVEEGLSNNSRGGDSPDWTDQLLRQFTGRDGTKAIKSLGPLWTKNTVLASLQYLRLWSLDWCGIYTAPSLAMTRTIRLTQFLQLSCPCLYWQSSLYTAIVLGQVYV